MMIVLKGLGLLAGLALLVHFGTHALQQRLLYAPDTRRTPPDEVGLISVEERELVMRDGTRVITWWGAAQPGRRHCSISTATADL